MWGKDMVWMLKTTTECEEVQALKYAPQPLFVVHQGQVTLHMCQLGFISLSNVLMKTWSTLKKTKTKKLQVQFRNEIQF